MRIRARIRARTRISVDNNFKLFTLFVDLSGLSTRLDHCSFQSITRKYFSY